MAGEELNDIKVTIQHKVLNGSSSPDEPQFVAYFHYGDREYRVYAPGAAKGAAADWVWNMIVRDTASRPVTESQRIFALKFVDEELNRTPGNPPKPGRFKKPKSIAGPFSTYTLGETINSGNSGAVYHAVNTDGQSFALKVLTRKDAGRAQVRFQNEITFCSSERSKNIIRVLEYGRTEDGFLFYVMPYYPTTLRDLIQKGITPPEVLPLFSQILDGLEAAHLFNVYHRDIKPENLLCNDDLKLIVVADFGISRFQQDELIKAANTAPHEKLANFVYAAPEQRVQGNAVDHRADIYAIGLILNEMFTGNVPQGTGFRRIEDVAAEFSYLDDLVESMIRQQPDERPQSIKEIKDQLIGRKNEFVNYQRIDALKRRVIPTPEINDPLILDPIHAVETLDFENSVLALRLNQGVNDVWVQCFRQVATSYSANVSASRIKFKGDQVLLHTDSHSAQQMINYFKQYAGPANEQYAKQAKAEQALELRQRREALANDIAKEEAKRKFLQNIKL